MRFLLILFLLANTSIFPQSDVFSKLDFVIGSWVGEGTGFGNSKSKIESSFKLAMNGKYVEVINDSKFELTEKKPKGENHIDKGFISYDKSRNKIIYRQFNIEGFVNQYTLVDSLSNGSRLLFETETIENFPPGGIAKLTINKIDENNIETIFDVAMPEKGYACFGTNKLKRVE